MSICCHHFSHPSLSPFLSLSLVVSCLSPLVEGFDNIQSRKVMIPVTELDGVPVVGMHELTHVFGTNAEFIVAVKKYVINTTFNTATKMVFFVP